MLFSSRRLWYYITLSLHHFQRLPFPTIELSSMQRTSRACFWTCLTLLLWSHIHSHTHLFAFSNLAISCGRPALSIWVSVLIYASPLPDAASPESFPLSQAHLHGSPVAPSWRAACPATLPSSSSDSTGGSPPCSFFVQLSCWVPLGWYFFLWFHKVWWFSDCALWVWMSPAIRTWGPSISLPSGHGLCCHRPCSRPLHSSILHSGLLSTSLLPQGAHAGQSVQGGWGGVCWKHMTLSPAGHIVIAGVSLSAAPALPGRSPRCHLASGGST